ncbi:MAG: hypothetical protein U0892_12280 [Pirellulales bacterium]
MQDEEIGEEVCDVAVSRSMISTIRNQVTQRIARIAIQIGPRVFRFHDMQRIGIAVDIATLRRNDSQHQKEVGGPRSE